MRLKKSLVEKRTQWQFCVQGNYIPGVQVPVASLGTLTHRLSQPMKTATHISLFLDKWVPWVS